jgi:hypothetical protein
MRSLRSKNAVFFRLSVPYCNGLNRIFFFMIKPTRYTNFTNLFWHESLHISDSSSVHHQEFIHFTQVCRQHSSRTILVLLECCLQTYMTFTIAECTVMMDRRTIRTM